MSRNSDNRRILEIIGAYLDGKATVEESVFLDKFYDCISDDDLPMPSEAAMRIIKDRSRRKVSLNILKHYNKEEINTLYLKYLWPVLITAGVTIIGCTALYFTAKKNVIDHQSLIADLKKIRLTTKQVIMTLGAGIRINIDNRSDRKIPSLDGVGAYLPKQNQLVYNANPVAGAEEVAYTTICAPTGLKYQFTLPDGTQVMLSSGSVIKFPNVFDANERRIELSGEAFFDVALNKNKPFKVVTSKQEFIAKESHFNIKDYVDRG